MRIQLEMELKALGLAFKAVPLASLTIPVNVKLVQSSDLVMLMPSSLALEQADSWQLEILPIELPVSVGPLVAISRGDRVVDRLRDALIEILSEEAKV